MFNGATSFNQPLDAWNVANVETMSCARLLRTSMGPSSKIEPRLISSSDGSYTKSPSVANG